MVVLPVEPRIFGPSCEKPTLRFTVLLVVITRSQKLAAARKPRNASVPGVTLLRLKRLIVKADAGVDDKATATSAVAAASLRNLLVITIVPL